MTAVMARSRASAEIGLLRNGEPVPVERPLRIAIELASPVQDKFEGFIATNREGDPEVVSEGCFAGLTCAIAGAGPSLALDTIRGVDHIFACNAALPWLTEHGVKVSGGVGIDQTPGLIREWPDPPDVPYYVASSCDPALIAHLRAHGRRCVFFHNAVGIPDEFATYCRTWPPTFMVGQGFTVVGRFIGVAQWMGFERIDIYGADCAFGPEDVAHVNGETATAAYGAPVVMDGVVNGRTWRTRPDMLMDAVDLVRRVRASNGRIRLMGDTLPVALLGKDDAYLDMVARRLNPGDLPVSD